MFILAAILTAIIPAAAMESNDRIEISHVNREIDISAYDDSIWSHSHHIEIDTYWSGEVAPQTRKVDTRVLWSNTALYVRFAAAQNEPLVVSDRPNLKRKARGLWNRDVCELFIAPDRAIPNKYFEFEVAPTGEWIDVGIEITPEKLLRDWDYRSEMQAFAFMDADTVFEIIKVPFKSLGRMPKAGDIWLGNLFRCVGEGDSRGYLAWRPTKTAKPSFHVPSAFGEFHFKS